MQAIQSRCMYHLGLLNLLRPIDLTDEELEEYRNMFSNTNIDPPHIYQDEIVDTVNDEILRIGIVRDAVGITHSDNIITSCKKKYKFDNVFNGDESSDTISVMTTFLEKRLFLKKDSTIMTIGYSKSGKTTLIQNLVGQLCGHKYSLSEIYLNKLYGYFPGRRGIKTLVEDFSECPQFATDDIAKVLDNFAKKSDNGVNSRSSRGHVVLKIHYECGTTITLIDIAGQEKLRNQDKLEAQAINGSIYNMSRYLQNPKHKDNKCILLNLVKSSKNIITCFMLVDNILSKAGTFLVQFAKLFT